MNLFQEKGEDRDYFDGRVRNTTYSKSKILVKCFKVKY
jgi:hypothetical protein